MGNKIPCDIVTFKKIIIESGQPINWLLIQGVVRVVGLCGRECAVFIK